MLLWMLTPLLWLLRHHHPLRLSRTHSHDRLHGHHLRLRLCVHRSRMMRVLHDLRRLLRHIPGRRTGVRLLRDHVLRRISLLHAS
jgi:hypothetical protein